METFTGMTDRLIIDSDPYPSLETDDWKVVGHESHGIVTAEKIGGRLYLNDVAAMLIYSPVQAVGGVTVVEIAGYLNGRRPLNATMLEFMLANPTLFSDEWDNPNEPFIYFLGTEYEHASSKARAIRCAHCVGHRWVTGFVPMPLKSKGQDFAIVFGR